MAQGSMIHWSTAQLRASIANIETRVDGNRLRFYKDGNEIGSTLMDGTSVSEYAVDMILRPEWDTSLAS